MKTTISEAFLSQPKMAYQELDRFVGKFSSLTPGQISRLKHIGDKAHALLRECNEAHAYITRVMAGCEGNKTVEDMMNFIAEIPLFQKKTFDDLTAIMDLIEMAPSPKKRTLLPPFSFLFRHQL